MSKSVKSLDKCPYCGSTFGYYSRKISKVVINEKYYFGSHMPIDSISPIAETIEESQVSDFMCMSCHRVLKTKE